MKAMIIADLMMSRSTTIQQLVIPFLIAICICVGMESLIVVPPIIILSVAYSRMFTLLALDEQNGWQRYRAAMPLSRAQIMIGRCIAFVILTIVACIFSLVVSALLAAILPPIAQAFGFSSFSLEFDMPALIITSAFGLLFAAVLAGATLPLYARFGMTRAVGYLPLALLVIVLIAFGVMRTYDIQVTQSLQNIVNQGLLMPSLALIALSIVVFVLGSALAVALYRKREF